MGAKSFGGLARPQTGGRFFYRKEDGQSRLQKQMHGYWSGWDEAGVISGFSFPSTDLW